MQARLNQMEILWKLKLMSGNPMLCSCVSVINILRFIVTICGFSERLLPSVFRYVLIGLCSRRLHVCICTALTALS